MYLSRRQTLALVVLVAVSLIGGGILAWRQANKGGVEVSAGTDASAPQAVGEPQCMVHVCGAVKNPGVYNLKAGSRVYEAVEKAGGALPEADQERINLAARIQDGQQIRLPDKIEAEAPAAATGAKAAGTPRASAPKVRFPLSLNQASAAELDAVPGIGPAIASRIVDYRQAKGSFAKLEDLLNVDGIGQKTLERFRPYLQVI